MKLFLLAAVAIPLPHAQEARDPRIGYLYPAGGRQGTVVHVLVGGQILNRPQGVHITGKGVRASIVRHLGRARPINGAARLEILRRLKEARPEAVKDIPLPRRLPKKGEVKLPKHPLIDNLEKLTTIELEFLVNEFLRPNFKRQPNAQIAETVLIEIAIDADAAPGDRELRLLTPLGLSNPLRFQVGRLPEVRETVRPAPPAEPVDLPVTLNGQVKPGDVDRWRFRAKEGRSLVFHVQARRLIPFLADAVPGWFQATLTLYDGAGRELAFADDDRFDPDPVLFYRIPATGVYELEIRDSLYRGRKDFVYRISIGEFPFVRSLFPLGAREGSERIATIAGWNLPPTRLPLDTRPAPERVRQTDSPRVLYAVDTLPESDEVEPNDDPERAQAIPLSRIVNGRIGTPGDTDVFQIRGKAGAELVAEVTARRLHSPLDSLLQLTDASGRIIAWNDDFVEKQGHLYRDMGTITHQADSYLRARLPADGIYYVHLSDVRRHGGEAYGYRLRIGPPRPDYSLLVTPSSINLRAGGIVPLTVHVLRRDGFTGAIDLRLKDAPAGFSLQGAQIPAGRPSVRLTLSATARRRSEPVTLGLEGEARIGGRIVRRPCVPADETMQAFLYRHLVPSTGLVAAVLGGGRRIPDPKIVAETPVSVPAGGTVTVEMRIPRWVKLDQVRFTLREPPSGVSLRKTDSRPGMLRLILAADRKTARVGLRDNLIVNAFVEIVPRGRNGKGAQPKRSVFVGVLPAIPFQVVR